MKKYICDVCGYIYDPANGDPDGGEARYSLREDPRRLDLPDVRSLQREFLSDRLERPHAVG